MIKKIIYKLKNLPKKGFSLLETSMIIMAVGTLVSGYITFVAPPSKSEADKYQETEEKLYRVKEKIEKFIKDTSRMPCPADITIKFGESNASNVNFAQEDLIGTNCRNNWGTVPTSSLGLDANDMLDGWGRKFTYVVAPMLCSPAGCNSNNYTSAPMSGAQFLTVIDASGTTISNQNVAFVLISHGSPGRGGYTQAGTPLNVQAGSLEEINANHEAPYPTPLSYRSGPVDVNINGFQHIVKYSTKKELDTRANLGSSGGKIIDLDLCLENSIRLAAINRNIATSATGLRNIPTCNTAISHSYSDENSQTVNVTLNRCDEAILDIMWNLQESCYELYPPPLMPENRACPGGGTYNKAEGACICNRGTWDGNC